MNANVEYIYDTDFRLSNEDEHTAWLVRCARTHGLNSVDLAYAFMSDERLLALNQTHLQHDTLTDILTFDDSIGLDIKANIAISIERVRENAQAFGETFANELLRVMAHGLLHCIGFDDTSEKKKNMMRKAEGACIKLFHVEHKSKKHVS